MDSGEKGWTEKEQREAERAALKGAASPYPAFPVIAVRKTAHPETQKTTRWVPSPAIRRRQPADKAHHSPEKSHTYPVFRSVKAEIKRNPHREAKDTDAPIIRQGSNTPQRGKRKPAVSMPATPKTNSTASGRNPKKTPQCRHRPLSARQENTGTRSEGESLVPQEPQRLGAERRCSRSASSRPPSLVPLRYSSAEARAKDAAEPKRKKLNTDQNASISPSLKTPHFSSCFNRFYKHN